MERRDAPSANGSDPCQNAAPRSENCAACHAQVRSVAFAVALDALQDAAFLVRDDGTPAHANAAGRFLLDAEPHVLLDDGGRFLRMLVEPAGAERHHVVVERTAKHAHARQLALLAENWRLTRREADVLGLVATGETNRAIATSLQCSEATVELHMTRLFGKTGAENRAALVARFWTEVRRRHASGTHRPHTTK